MAPVSCCFIHVLGRPDLNVGARRGRGQSLSSLMGRTGPSKSSRYRRPALTALPCCVWYNVERKAGRMLGLAPHVFWRQSGSRERRRQRCHPGTPPPGCRVMGPPAVAGPGPRYSRRGCQDLPSILWGRRLWWWRRAGRRQAPLPGLAPHQSAPPHPYPTIGPHLMARVVSCVH